MAMHQADKLKTWPCSDNVFLKLVLLKSLKVWVKSDCLHLIFYLSSDCLRVSDKWWQTALN